MDVNYFKGKKITVFGLGLHGGGVGVVKFLVSHGAKVIVTDIQPREKLKPSLDKLKNIKGITYVLGHHRVEDFTKVDMVVKTPPAPWSNKHIKLAQDNGVPVEMDSTLFFKLCRNPVIGVTGTKGKTTTATLIYEILRLTGRNPIKVGIGQTSVLDKIDMCKKNVIPVFELSSWRLSGLKRHKMSPHIAVMKNIYPDHLNYYKSMDTYIADKKAIYSSQKPTDWLIINVDDENLKGMDEEAPSQIVKLSKKPINNGISVFIEDEAIYLDNGIDRKKLAGVFEVKLRGEHNISNVMAAIGAVFAYGLSIDEIKKAIKEVKGVPHRLEFVRELNGVSYYNDTAATIPEAAVSALNSFKRPIIVIVGGADKNLDFSQLAKAVLDKTKGVVFIQGDATDKLIAEIKKNLSSEEKEDSKFIVVDSMEKAVEVAYRSAEKNDIVLLSPGAASFGIFANEFERGNKFKEVVNNLK